MSQQIRRRVLAVLAAPLLGAVCSGGAAVAGESLCDECPCPAVTGPVTVPDLYLPAPTRTSEPDVVREADPTEVPAAPRDSTGVPEPTPLGDVETLAPPMNDSPVSDFADFDLSTGLATNFGGGGATSLAFADSPIVSPGYIESAPIQTRIRVRYDNATGANDPARGGFLYPTLATGGTAGGGLFSGGRGPTGAGGGVTNNIDLQELSTYIEVAMRERFSLFVDLANRWVGIINVGAGNETARGLGDIRAGMRWGWINDPCEHLTLQLRTSMPTGDPLRALGTGNTAMDVGLLYDKSLGCKTRLYAELNDWFTLDAVTLTEVVAPISESLLNQDANILRAGLGLGYDILECKDRCHPKTLTLLTECVLWTVLDGNSVNIVSGELTDAVGDTIVNGKYGMRYTDRHHSIYVGYGHDWTKDKWYSDLFRLEYQWNL